VLRAPRSVRPIAACVVLVAVVMACVAASEGPARGLSSRLPIVVIDADGPIVDDPKVGATMRVIHRGGGALNRTGDAADVYDGRIRIEVRGRSSQRFPKKQFALETVDAQGDNRNVRLLGMPRENDWILYAAYNDATSMRNVVAYRAARFMDRYAARTRFVELVLNGRYWGVYVLMESLKLDDDRVTSPVPGSEGFLLEFTDGARLGPRDEFVRTPVSRTPIVFADPRRRDMEPSRVRAVAGRLRAYERALYGRDFRHPVRGYRRHLDLQAAVDYALLNEFLRNRDAFRASTFIHEGRGGRLAMGPVWDFDLAMGYPRSTSGPQGCTLCGRRWAARWYDDPAFVRAMTRRWAQLRRRGLVRRLVTEIERDGQLVADAQVRNLRRWRRLGPVPVSRTISDPVLRDTYLQETRRLTQWLRAREAWMTANLPRIGRMRAAPDSVADSVGDAG